MSDCTLHVVFQDATKTYDKYITDISALTGVIEGMRLDYRSVRPGTVPSGEAARDLTGRTQWVLPENRHPETVDISVFDISNKQMRLLQRAKNHNYNVYAFDDRFAVAGHVESLQTGLTRRTNNNPNRTVTLGISYVYEAREYTMDGLTVAGEDPSSSSLDDDFHWNWKDDTLFVYQADASPSWLPSGWNEIRDYNYAFESDPIGTDLTAEPVQADDLWFRVFQETDDLSNLDATLFHSVTGSIWDNTKGYNSAVQVGRSWWVQ